MGRKPDHSAFDHFPDVSKMIGNIVFGIFAGGLCLGDNIQEVIPLGVT